MIVGYIERLFLALDAQDYAFPDAPRPDAFVVALGDAAEARAVVVAQSLRKQGLAVDLALATPGAGRSMKAQMKAAARSRARYAVILGDDELARGVAAVRDLDGGTQTDVALDALAEAIWE